MTPPNDDQLDGQACWYCGRRDGAMVPIGHAPRPPSFRKEGVSQIFAHRQCKES